MDGEKKKLDSLVQKTSRVLIRISTVFPFEFFPTIVTVDEKKVSISRGIFFSSRTIESILVKDIRTVIVSSNILFASVKIQLGPMATAEQGPPTIYWLWKNDADRLRRIILGLVACEEEDIDLSQFEKRDLIRKVDQIGNARVG